MSCNKKIKILFFSLVLLIGILNAGLALAANERWRLPEVQYPQVPFPGVETPNQFIQKIHNGVQGYTPEKALPLYIKYFYYLALSLAGFLVLGSIIYGGFQYLISGNSPIKMVDARQQIASGISGLIILFSSYVILTTINPQLAIFNLEAPAIEKCDCSKPPGELSEYCQRTCQTSIQPSENVPVYIEIPVGRMIESVIAKTINAEDVASTTNIKAAFLKSKVDELNRLTQRCSCSGSGVSTQCGAGGCSGGFCVGDPCPDRNRINALVNAEIPSASQDVQCWKWQTLASKLALENEYINLRLAEDFMRDSLLPPTTYEDFAGLEGNKTIRKLTPWQNIDKTVDPLGTIRDKIDPNVPGLNGAEDPATFYVPEKGNQDLISLVENVASPVLPPPPPPGCFGSPICEEGQTKPYTTCDGSSCTTINSCGISSCSGTEECSAAPPAELCLPGETRPHSVCDGDACRSVNSCGTSQCQNNNECIVQPPPLPTRCSLGNGPCASNNLIGSGFTWDPNQASRICQGESGSSPLAKNDSCLRNGTCDYSVGLFQMNLLDPCKEGLSYGNVRFGNGIMYCQCSVKDQNRLNLCLTSYGWGAEPETYQNNIERAKQMYNYRNNWCAWGVAYRCGLCP